MMVALRSSETPVLTRITRRNIPEDTILDFYIPEDDIVTAVKTSNFTEN
jgi:hypothetical protein